MTDMDIDEIPGGRTLWRPSALMWIPRWNRSISLDKSRKRGVTMRGRTGIDLTKPSDPEAMRDAVICGWDRGNACSRLGAHQHSRAWGITRCSKIECLSAVWAVSQRVQVRSCRRGGRRASMYVLRLASRQDFRTRNQQLPPPPSPAWHDICSAPPTSKPEAPRISKHSFVEAEYQHLYTLFLTFSTTTTTMNYPTYPPATYKMQAEKRPAPVPITSYRRPFSALKTPSPPASASASSGDDESSCFSSLTTWFYNLLPSLRPASQTAEKSLAPQDSEMETEYTVSEHPRILPPPTLFPEWTPAELETLITRWMCTHPGTPPASPHPRTPDWTAN
jgi:hypothetical protein